MVEEEFRFEDPGRVRRLAKTLDNRLRVEVLLAHANGGPSSATMLARAGLDSLANISYHQGRLVEWGVLGCVETTKVRGAHEHRYDLTEFGKEVLRAAVLFGGRR